MNEQSKSFSKNFKVTVVVETPEGVKTGSAVRKISNSLPMIDLPDVGNPAGVVGEAVVVDLDERGVFFALISHHADNEFYNAFPVPGNKISNGGASETGIRYYKTLKPGTKGTLSPNHFPGYPKIVTFIDMNDPKSVTPVMIWKRDEWGKYSIEKNNFEELFGEGVALKNITLEITEEHVTWSKVDEYLPVYDQSFWDWYKKLNYGDPRRITPANFK